MSLFATLVKPCKRLKTLLSSGIISLGQFFYLLLVPSKNYNCLRMAAIAETVSSEIDATQLMGFRRSHIFEVLSLLKQTTFEEIA